MKLFNIFRRKVNIDWYRELTKAYKHGLDAGQTVANNIFNEFIIDQDKWEHFKLCLEFYNYNLEKNIREHMKGDE